MKTHHGIRIIFIWDLQSIRTKRQFRTRDLELGCICRRLRELSRELEIPVLAISQLNRTVEYRGGTRRPQLADLRDSGNIELEADKVLLLYRPEYYQIDVDEMGNSTKFLLELTVARNQTGKVGSIFLKRNAEFTKITDFDGYTSDITISPRRLSDLDENDTPF
jgi:replicative DNA helicase